MTIVLFVVPLGTIRMTKAGADQHKIGIAIHETAHHL